MKSIVVDSTRYSVGMAVRTKAHGLPQAVIVEIEYKMFNVDDEKADIKELYPNDYCPPRVIVRPIRRVGSEVL